MGMFRSSENEFLLCYDGEGDILRHLDMNSHTLLHQSLACMWTGTVIRTAQMA